MRQSKAVAAPDANLAAAMAEQAERASELLKAMSHPQRLRVLCLLVEGERSVGEINREIELSQSALSQHLAKLREEGLVTTRKEAQTVFYSLTTGPALEVIRTLHDVYCPGDNARICS
jgi:DNA-binding transcriptional ArsR family regulator